MRQFESGATRDNDDNKPDYEGFLAPSVLRAYGAYMQKNRVQADGKLRDSDNWQKGIPRKEYIKSMYRHFLELQELYRWEKKQDEELARLHAGDDQDAYEYSASNYDSTDGQQLEKACALLFNVMGYIFELREGR